MKKITALRSAMLLTAMGVGTAQSATLSPGVGEVLIYPYYTVNNNLNTLYSVVNTTDETKAVKIVFREGDNGKETLIYNVYLAPHDVWTAALSSSDDGGASLSSVDTSCAPYLDLNGQAFLDFAYTEDPGSDEEEREREGYFEVYEMGVVTDAALVEAIAPVNDIPSNCGAVQQAWAPSEGQWAVDPTDGVSAPTGGLMGNAIVVDVEQGTAVSYKATAITGFYAENQSTHFAPGSGDLSLDSAAPRSVVAYQGEAIESNWPRGVDAISALLMTKSIYNEFVLGSGINALTEQVFTFPTKTFYVNSDDLSGAGPFTQLFLNADGACETFKKDRVYNRSGEVPFDAGANITPIPPGFYEADLCWSTNVVAYYIGLGIPSEAVPDNYILGSNNVTNVASGIHTNNDLGGFTSGWMEVRFSESNGMTDADSVYEYKGYPVLGFGVQSYTNVNAQPGLLAQYAALFEHNYKKKIVAVNAE